MRVHIPKSIQYVFLVSNFIIGSLCLPDESSFIIGYSFTLISRQRHIQRHYVWQASLWMNHWNRASKKIIPNTFKPLEIFWTCIVCFHLVGFHRVILHVEVIFTYTCMTYQDILYLLGIWQSKRKTNMTMTLHAWHTKRYTCT